MLCANKDGEKAAYYRVIEGDEEKGVADLIVPLCLADMYKLVDSGEYSYGDFKSVSKVGPNLDDLRRA